jgi:transposase
MREGIIVEVSAVDRSRLEAIVADRNSPQKHVWRARIVLLTADGLGTGEIMRRAGTSKVTVWRWRERFMRAGVGGLLRDSTRPSRIPPMPRIVHQRTVALTLADPPDEVTHWTAEMMSKAVGISVSSVQRIWRAHGLQPHGCVSSSCRATPSSCRSCGSPSGSMSIRRRMPLRSASTRNPRSRRSTAPRRGCR